MENSAGTSILEEEEEVEERTLNLLHNTDIDQHISEVKLRKRGGKRQKLKWAKRSMAIPEVIHDILDENLRENALERLSYYLIQRRKEEPENYYKTGYLLYNSCGTMTILLKELMVFSRRMVDENLDRRSLNRITNVLTLFQSVAANSETRNEFVKSGVPSFLTPVIQFGSQVKAFQLVRTVALSVVGILCQAREPLVIRWAIQSQMVETCRASIEVGSELSRVVGMHIIEAILQDPSGLSYTCTSGILPKLMYTFGFVVNLLAADPDFSPRLLFHIIRCYYILCPHPMGYTAVKNNLPQHFFYGYFHETTKEYPMIGSLLNQLLLTLSR